MFQKNSNGGNSRIQVKSPRQLLSPLFVVQSLTVEKKNSNGGNFRSQVKNLLAFEPLFVVSSLTVNDSDDDDDDTECRPHHRGDDNVHDAGGQTAL